MRRMDSHDAGRAMLGHHNAAAAAAPDLTGLGAHVERMQPARAPARRTATPCSTASRSIRSEAFPREPAELTEAISHELTENRGKPDDSRDSSDQVIHVSHETLSEARDRVRAAWIEERSDSQAPKLSAALGSETPLDSCGGPQGRSRRRTRDLFS